MTKRELVIDVAERLGYTQNEVANVVQASLDAITECLANGQRIEIRNFGVFEIKTRDARIGRNPRTGQEVPISEKRVATFKPGKALKERVEGTSSSADDAPRPVATAQLGSGLAVVEEEGGQFRLL
ncbi:MAG: DNA-binding protein HU-beta [Candidatus Hydrogenedentes bacterium]|nr:DNA-binding protein HU-beta [Candidatus Hydrogenedentota bacterium]